MYTYCINGYTIHIRYLEVMKNEKNIIKKEMYKNENLVKG